MPAVRLCPAFRARLAAKAVRWQQQRLMQTGAEPGGSHTPQAGSGIRDALEPFPAAPSQTATQPIHHAAGCSVIFDKEAPCTH